MDHPSYLTPPEVAEILRVSHQKVLGWIHKAELRAVNVGNGVRPRYRVSREDLDSFLKIREVQPPVPRPKRRRQRQPEGGPIDPALGMKLLRKGQATKVGNSYYRVHDGVILFF